MGRARKQKTRDKNKQSLPQTPKKDIAGNQRQEDVELAEEVDDLYELKARPGYVPTEVNRKGEKS
ncbi:YfhD family protein [Alteribacter populi]|uniref:YfhD family protein n=1 Tax=Alteribacter populi TaxID=2011011 RepID=UPI000C2B9CBB|nr:YfhD family protein [Alteribacter populi]